MKKLFLALAAIVAATAVTAAQTAPQKADEKIDGKWNMSVNANGQPMDIVVVFKTDGKKLTGTLTGPAGETALEGEYAEKKLTFGISVTMNGQAMDISFAGNMKDDGSMAGTATGPFGELAWTASRAR